MGSVDFSLNLLKRFILSMSSGEYDMKYLFSNPRNLYVSKSMKRIPPTPARGLCFAFFRLTLVIS